MRIASLWLSLLPLLGCLDPLVSDQVERPDLILPAGSEPPLLGDDFTARAALDALDAPHDLAAGQARAASPRANAEVPRGVRPYASHRVSVSPQGESLVVKANNGAARGFGGAFMLVFAFAWLAFVAFWTSMTIGVGAPIIFPIFSIPFWFVGVTMLWKGLHGLLGTTRLALSPAGLVLERRLGGIRMKRIEASLEDIVELASDDKGKVELFTRTQHLQLLELPSVDATEVRTRLQEHFANLRA